MLNVDKISLQLHSQRKLGRRSSWLAGGELVTQGSRNSEFLSEAEARSGRAQGRQVGTVQLGDSTGTAEKALR